MRVMCKQDNERNSLEVIEIVDVGFEEDIFDDGCDHGLFMVDSKGNYLYFSDVDMKKCDSICRELLEKGFCDLSDLGVYMFDPL